MKRKLLYSVCDERDECGQYRAAVEVAEAPGIRLHTEQTFPCPSDAVEFLVRFVEDFVRGKSTGA